VPKQCHLNEGTVKHARVFEQMTCFVRSLLRLNDHLDDTLVWEAGYQDGFCR